MKLSVSFCVVVIEMTLSEDSDTKYTTQDNTFLPPWRRHDSVVGIVLSTFFAVKSFDGMGRVHEWVMQHRDRVIFVYGFVFSFRFWILELKFNCIEICVYYVMQEKTQAKEISVFNLHDPLKWSLRERTVHLTWNAIDMNKKPKERQCLCRNHASEWLSPTKNKRQEIHWFSFHQEMDILSFISPGSHWFNILL
jgi:hypothetical protein